MIHQRSKLALEVEEKVVEYLEGFWVIGVGTLLFVFVVLPHF